ncbi:MAG: hypothetical protein RIT81_10215 [Deltaproteobacteria bacterium]
MTLKKNNNNQDAVALRINGSLMGVAPQPKLCELAQALRGIALSDSPVLLRGSEDICHDLVEQLHKLGRRSSLPMHNCHSPEEAETLFRTVFDEEDEPNEDALGTWALFRVEAWPRELQVSLQRILEVLDESRLHGRLRHDRIPRVVVVQESDSDGRSLDPALKRRLSYFNLSATRATNAELVG